MDRYAAFLREVLQLAGEIYFQRVEAELWKFSQALDQWLHELFARPRPDWRESLDQLLSQQAAEGRVAAPESRWELIDFLEGWAKTVDWNSIEGGTSGDDRPTPVAAEVASQSDPDRPAPLPKNWPALTASEAESAQRSTGLPPWYPIQPRNRMDSFWEKRFESFGQAGRDRLLAFFREVAALGHISRAIQNPEEFDVEPLVAQQEKVQKAYDSYIRAKLDVYHAWTRYLSMEWFVGPEVYKVFGKIDIALPDRVEGFTSSHDGELKAARRSSYEATNKKVRRTDAAYTTLVWTDNVIAVIEIATLVGSAKAVFTQAAKKMAAKGLSEAAARGVAVAYAVAHLGTAAASAAVIGGLIPKILVDAGLDEADVRAGLAIFRTIFTLVGLRALAKQPRRPSRPHRGRPKDKGPQEAESIRWDETHPLIEGVPDARRTRAHKILQQAVAEEMQAEGSYVRVGMGRPLSEFSGLKHSPDIRPDNIGLTIEGRIDMFEIRSPSQTKEKLEAKLMTALNQLPPEMRGEIRVSDPGDAFK